MTGDSDKQFERIVNEHVPPEAASLLEYQVGALVEGIPGQFSKDYLIGDKYQGSLYLQEAYYTDSDGFQDSDSTYHMTVMAPVTSDTEVTPLFRLEVLPSGEVRRTFQEEGNPDPSEGLAILKGILAHGDITEYERETVISAIDVLQMTIDHIETYLSEAVTRLFELSRNILATKVEDGILTTIVDCGDVTLRVQKYVDDIECPTAGSQAPQIEVEYTDPKTNVKTWVGCDEEQDIFVKVFETPDSEESEYDGRATAHLSQVAPVYRALLEVMQSHYDDADGMWLSGYADKLAALIVAIGSEMPFTQSLAKELKTVEAKTIEKIQHELHLFPLGTTNVSAEMLIRLANDGAHHNKLTAMPDCYIDAGGWTVFLDVDEEVEIFPNRLYFPSLDEAIALNSVLTRGARIDALLLRSSLHGVSKDPEHVTFQVGPTFELGTIRYEPKFN